MDHAMHSPSQPTKKKIEDYEVDNAVDTLLRAEEIKRNEPLMELVSKKIQIKKKAINSIAELRAIKNEMKDSKENDDVKPVPVVLVAEKQDSDANADKGK